MQLTVRTLHRLLSAVDEVNRLLPAAQAEGSAPDFIANLTAIVNSPEKVMRLRMALTSLKSSGQALENCILVGEVRV